MERRLHFVTGKGGVGKSTVAAALAFAAAARGARVLAIELGDPAGLCRTLRVRPRSPGEIEVGASGVHVAYFDGAAALAEYLTRKLHLRRFLRPILEHPLYEAFVGAAPGLRELVAIGKIRDEFSLQHGRWDCVVVDAGASGHALEHLRMPATAARTFAKGLVHREAAANAELLRDPQQCAIHVVATPEEMPIGEAIQTVEALRAYELAIGRVIVNRCIPPAPLGVDAAIAGVPHPARDVVKRAREWECVQERSIATLQRTLGLAVVRTPRLPVTEDVARRLAWPLAEVA